MPTLSPQTLTRAEQSTLLAVTAAHPRDHLTLSFALGTGLRLAEIVRLDVGDVYSPPANRNPGAGSAPRSPRVGAPQTYFRRVAWTILRPACP